MSARQHRSRRWERWNTRPAQRSLASRPRRARFTSDDLTASIDTSMQAGEMMGRKWGERDLYRALSEMLDDPIALAAWVGSQVMAQDLDDFLLVERVREADPETVRQVADILDRDDLTGEEKKVELEAFAREIGAFPDGEAPLPADEQARREAEERTWWSAPAATDDLLDVADAAGVTPLADVDAGELVDDLERWLRDGGTQE